MKERNPHKEQNSIIINGLRYKDKSHLQQTFSVIRKTWVLCTSLQRGRNICPKNINQYVGHGGIL